MVKVFHEISHDTVGTALQRGILLGTGGDKRDREIHETDEFLNKYRPARLEEKGVDRQTNNYCYLSKGENIIDITSGKEKTLSEFLSQSKQALLQIEVDPALCYVSDLDLYDQIKELFAKGDETNARRLAPVYWNSLQLLADYPGGVRRPEVIVPYNIPASAITKVG
jgi:hypothetical protein